MVNFVKNLATIGVSEFVLIFLLVLTITGVAAVSSPNINFQQIITPPPPPSITTILGDERTQAVLVIGKSIPQAKMQVYVFSDPLSISTTADADGTFFAVFTSDILPPGVHQFTAATVLGEQRTTDPSPKVAVIVADDYTLSEATGSQVPTVKIGNADEATSQLLRSIIHNQEAVKKMTPADVPQPNRQLQRTRIILVSLLAVLAIETGYLLWLRALRKTAQGQSFFHLGRGFHRLSTKS